MLATRPPFSEAAIAARLRRIAMPPVGRRIRQTLKPTPDVLAEARRHYADHCATCHTNDGSGNAPMARIYLKSRTCGNLIPKTLATAKF